MYMITATKPVESSMFTNNKISMVSMVNKTIKLPETCTVNELCKHALLLLSVPISLMTIVSQSLYIILSHKYSSFSVYRAFSSGVHLSYNTYVLMV